MRLRRRRAARSSPPTTGPLLSVVVPAYQVREWLADCLEAVLAQTYTSLEVVVVDDGSTDGTGELADAYAGRDGRVRVVHQANAGLGAARNAGVAVARGPLLAFADSDDVVPPDAYATMVASLERTGSAIAIGAVDRFRGRWGDADRWRTPLMAENHAAPQDATTVEERPLLLADVFAWNKVYRRDFWDAEGLEFPAGVRYEDQPALTRALVAAPAIDVLAEVVYGWRVREDGTSISQQRASLADLSDRWLTKRWSTRTVEERCSARVREIWYARVLPVDLAEYVRAVPGCDPAYWDLLRAGVREFWHEGTLPVWRTALPPRQRLLLWLVDAGRRDDVEALLGWLDAHPAGPPRILVGGREVLDHPFRGDPDLPEALRDL